MNNPKAQRAPIVAIMGHVDHGKSTLLDFIRKTNIVDGEAGGITQHLSAYEVHHQDDEENVRTITFLDTPGHEAFTKMRMRGAEVADIAILVVSAEDGVKQQTIEAFQTIKNAGIPFIVAINKIDKPGADIERTKLNLSENEIYVEGFGGTVPFVPISAKKGTNIPDLLSTILLVADLEEFHGDAKKPGEGIVIESHTDPKAGISATLIIQNGSIKRGQFVVAGNSLCPTRMLADFLGKQIESAQFSSPVSVTGWTSIPPAGAVFQTFDTKKEAEKALEKSKEGECDLMTTLGEMVTHETKLIPLIIKTDVLGTFEAIDKQICKLQRPEVAYKLVQRGVGNISEIDINFAQADKDVIIVGFNVGIDKNATELNMQVGATVKLSNVIYELTEWLEKEMEARRPRKSTANVTGSLKVLKIFNSTKDKQVVGGEVISGILTTGASARLVRNEEILGTGVIRNLQQNKIEAKEVKEGQCGLMFEIKTEVIPGDVLEIFTMIDQ
jgi:translation initiation factor IF-2